MVSMNERTLMLELYIFLSVCLSLCMSLHVSLACSVCLSLSPCHYLSPYVSVCLSVFLSLYLSPFCSLPLLFVLLSLSQLRLCHCILKCRLSVLVNYLCNSRVITAVVMTCYQATPRVFYSETIEVPDDQNFNCHVSQCMSL